jgi:6-phosphofructokinase 1
MSGSIKHIGIFTSGGDSPGMNAALYGATKAVLANGMRISGIRRGYEGMIDGDFVSLHEKDLQRTVHKGGTILKTARSERFRKVEGRKIGLKNLKKSEIDALIAIGAMAPSTVCWLFRSCVRCLLLAYPVLLTTT